MVGYYILMLWQYGIMVVPDVRHDTIWWLWMGRDVLWSLVQHRDVYMCIVYSGAVLIGVLLHWCVVHIICIVKCYCIVLVGVLLGHSGSGDSSDRGRWELLALPTHLLMDARHWKQPLLLPFCFLCFGNKYIMEHFSWSGAVQTLTSEGVFC